MAVINPVEIKVPFEKLKKIIHISDLHIRLYKRHKEYREAFAQLYNDLKFKGQIFEDSVIIVTGDLLHAKTDLSPEMIDLVSDFLVNLSNIATTLVVIGNHDMNLANTFRLDSLSPIIDNISHDKLYYLRNSGIYRVADTDIAIFSIIGDRKEWPKAKKCTAPNKVAVCHSPVNDAKTDTGYVITNRHVDVSLFDGYHIVLLGDIHRHQVLQQYDGQNKPLIAYAGSVIQQNHGESLKGHGWLEWDIPTRTFDFHDLYNTYGYCTLIIEEGKVPDLDGIPPNVRLRVFVKDIEPSKVKKIQSILAKRFNLQEFTVNKMRNAELTLQNQRYATEFIDVHDLEVQNQLMDSYLTSHHALVDDELLTRIHDLNKTINAQIAEEDLTRNVHWKPLLFEFSNMFSYGEDNVIDFEAMEGINGLFSGNATGKSAAFDALMFCLFDKTPRAFKGSHIMNNRKNKFSCFLKFDINGIEYEIRRVGKRKKNGEVRVDVDFWRVDSASGERVPLNAEDRRATSNVIRRYVGTYEDFILTSLSLQNNNALFIDKGQSERKDLLSQFMGINIFDKLYTIALDEMKEAGGALKLLSKTDFTQELADSQTRIEELNTEYQQFEKIANEQKTEKDDIEAKMSKLYEAKIPLDIDDVNIETLEDAKTILADSIDGLGETKIQLNDNCSALKAQSGSLSETVTKYSQMEIDKEHMLMTKYRDACGFAHRELDVLFNQIDSDQAKLDHMVMHEFDPECEFCVKNNQNLVFSVEQLKKELRNNKDKRDSLETDISRLEEKLENSDTIMVDFGTAQEVREEIRKVDRDLLMKRAELSETKNKITRHKAKLKETEAQIKKYHKSVDAIKKNAQIDEKLSVLEERGIELDDELRLYLGKLRGLHGKLQVEKSNKKKLLEQITEMEEIEQTIHAYQFYIEAIKRDGIPYELIIKVIPSIQSEVNNILSQIADFTIELDLDGKNINGRICYDDERQWPLEMSSGMERFISSLAIRVALMTVSNLPKPNFLIIDEGLGTLEAENLIKMHMLFSILKNQFDFIIIISHLETVRDMADSLMEIQVENGYSKINY
jgi:DNA repair exonuclease SbcCD ATPase subunit